MNPHQALAIAQIVFYAPVVPIAFHVGIRAWKYGPRMAWYPPMPFALGMWFSPSQYLSMISICYVMSGLTVRGDSKTCRRHIGTRRAT